MSTYFNEPNTIDKKDYLDPIVEDSGIAHYVADLGGLTRHQLLGVLDDPSSSDEKIEAASYLIAREEGFTQ